MNILVLGSGGREHAFALKISQSPLCSRLFVAPGNPGTATLGENIAIGVNEMEKLGEFCLSHSIDLLVVGPEEPLVKGLRDHFNSEELKHVRFVGPDKSGAILEGSKDFSKAFMKRHQIPTARYESFTATEIAKAESYAAQQALPLVLKADGLAAGKGVLICNTREEVTTGLKSILSDKKFGEAGSLVVIEEFLKGIELSVFVLCDGKDYKILPSAKDYKRIGEGDTGLNTGGMGAISPVPFADEAFLKKVEDRIIIPTVSGLRKENIHYVGFLFIGLMNVNGDPFVIEYNCRMGDPETEAVLPRIHSDFVDLLHKCASGNISSHALRIDERTTATVMLVSKGYPEDYEKGKRISGTDEIEGSIVFHAGTKLENGDLLTSGGRVIAVTSFGKNIQEAVQMSIANAEKISFEGKYFRYDIGYEFLQTTG